MAEDTLCKRTYCRIRHVPPPAHPFLDIQLSKSNPAGSALAKPAREDGIYASTWGKSTLFYDRTVENS